MSLRFEEETNVYDSYGNLLGQVFPGDEGHDPSFAAVNNCAEIIAGELREIADYLEAQ